MLEIGDNFIVLNNVVWKRIGFLYYDRLLKKRDWKIRSDYICGIRSRIDRLCLLFFIFLLLYFCKSVDYIVSLIYKSETNVLLFFVLPILLFLILFWNYYKFTLLCMWFVPVPFCIQVTTSRARICVHMCVRVSRFALISNHAYTRTCWECLFCWLSIVYRWFSLFCVCMLLKIRYL